MSNKKNIGGIAVNTHNREMIVKGIGKVSASPDLIVIEMQLSVIERAVIALHLLSFQTSIEPNVVISSIPCSGYNSNIILGGAAMFVIDNQFTNANIARTVRFTEKIFNDLNETAEKNDISFNMLVLQCCRYALDQMEGMEK